MRIPAPIQQRIRPRVRGWLGSWLLLLACETCSSAAGPREFQLRNWTYESGIPGITVNAVAQTPDGYLWVGTSTGLARFDGVRFVSVDLGRKVGRREASVTSLRADLQGSLWIGMEDGYLIQLQDAESVSWLPPSRQTGNRYIQSIARDDASGMWTLNLEGGLYRFAGERFTEAGAGQDILALVSGADGGVWAASKSELFQSDGGRLKSVWSGAQEPGFIPVALSPATAGGCWVADNGRLRRLDNGRWVEHRATFAEADGAVTGFIEDREGRLWLGSYGGGVAVFEKDGTERRLTRKEGLPSDLVRCLFEDREGNVWVGLEGRGLVRVRTVLFDNYANKLGFADEVILCVCEGDDGEVWFGTNGEGVQWIGKGGRTRRYGREDGLTNPFVWALCRDRAGRLWAGTWGGGLYRLEGERFVNFTSDLGTDSVVLALHEDLRGRLWLGMRTGPEPFVAVIEKEQVRKYALPGTRRRLEVRHIVETPDGSLWFGTTEAGLLRWKDGHFIGLNSPPAGLSTGSISALSVDASGGLWVAGHEVGLVRWENEHFKVVVPPGLLPQTLVQVTDDRLGYLWCASGEGVFRVAKSALEQTSPGSGMLLNWQRFTKSDGLPSNSCNSGGRRMSDGRIWICTLGGAAMLDPDQPTSRPPPPPVLIEEVFIAGRRAYDRRLPSVVKRGETGLNAGVEIASSEPVTLIVPPGSGPIDVHYTALNLGDPESVRFRHQLRGLDDAIMEAGSARSVRYNYLPPGKFGFLVAARNEGGEYGEAVAVLNLDVLPYFWQATWFQIATMLASVLLVSAIVGFVFRARHRRRTAQLERVQAIERERARIARDIHDDLGGSLTEISFLGTLAVRENTPPSETREQVGRIVARAHEMAQTLNEIVWAVNPRNDSLSGLSPYLCHFAQEFLATTPVACRLEVQERLPEVPLTPEARHNVFLVLKEALNNCVRHSGATRFRLSLQIREREFMIQFDDNGHGFDVGAAVASGNGLANMKLRAEAAGARFSIRSQPGGGTTICLFLPLPRIPKSRLRGSPNRVRRE